jgi:purine-nucleoside/S-methyl-5'-thioadenosine phosphorylase / adenosine deaminase
METMIWPDIFDGCVKGFFTRKSTGADKTILSRVLSISPDNICMPVQKHTDTVWLLNEEHTPATADAVLTQTAGILIGVQVADCVPVLLHDEGKSVIGAVHAGWKGTSLQILKKTLSMMVEHFGSDPQDIKVAFGPSIRGHCYAVDNDVKEAVVRATGPGDYVMQRNGKYCVDLTSANMLQALSSGISSQHIWQSPECTYCNPSDFHSFRYQRNHAGRQGGFIGIF